MFYIKDIAFFLLFQVTCYSCYSTALVIAGKELDAESITTTIVTPEEVQVVELSRSDLESESQQPDAHELSVDPTSDFRTHYNFDLLPSFNECGLSWEMSQKKNHTRRKRIVGGKLAKLGKYPWLGRLELYEGGSGNSSERCGSSLINSRYVLTAAHCVTRIPSGHSVSKVAFGTVDIRKTRECISGKDNACTDKKRYEIEEVIIHEDYITGSLLNDIALVRLTEPVKFDAFVSPVCLPRDESLLKKWTNSKITVAGFGRSNGDDDNKTHYPNLMHELDLPLVSRSECETFYRRRTGPLDKSRFCAGGEPERGDCRGDSGGPLMKVLPVDEVGGAKRVVQFGLVSYGHCALEGVPGGYINVLYYMPWILDNIEP